jgi:hypothetical protein
LIPFILCAFVPAWVGYEAGEQGMEQRNKKTTLGIIDREINSSNEKLNLVQVRAVLYFVWGAINQYGGFSGNIVANINAGDILVLLAFVIRQSLTIAITVFENAQSCIHQICLQGSM